MSSRSVSLSGRQSKRGARLKLLKSQASGSEVDDGGRTTGGKLTRGQRRTVAAWAAQLRDSASTGTGSRPRASSGSPLTASTRDRRRGPGGAWGRTRRPSSLDVGG